MYEKNSTPKYKLAKVMKICSLQVALALMFSGLVLAHTNYGQVLEKKVTITLTEVSIEEALQAIEQLADVKFFYSVDQLNIGKHISLRAADRTLGEVLDEVLTPFGIQFKVHEKNRTITLKRVSRDGPARSTSSNGGTTYAAATVQGVVVASATQQPLVGVNIIIKGTTRGTTTDAGGRFTIRAEDDDVLVFSFIGYRTFETQVGGRTTIDVALDEDVKNLTGVEINAGYYKTTKELQTGNIIRIESEEIEKQPVLNPLAALQGRVPGLEIIQETGVPGGNFTVRIRGTNSIANGNDPLYIIDGVPFISSTLAMPETSNQIFGTGTSPLNGINPSDIESIEVLKDADATAIYGSRGSNGVILITTKTGTAEDTKIDVKVYAGAGQVTNTVNLLTSSQYVEMRKEAFLNDNIVPGLANATDLLLWDTTRYTDWQKMLIGGSAQIKDAQLSLSGGTKNTQFVLSGGFHNETTVFPGDNTDKRISLHSNLKHSSADGKINLNVSINYSVNETDLLYRDLTGQALALPPVAPKVYDDNGELNWQDWAGVYENPFANTKRAYEAGSGNLFANTVIAYEILPHLQLRANLGYTNMRLDAISTTPVSSQDPATAPQNTSVFSNSAFKNWIAEPQINWIRAVGESNFDVLLGSTFLEQVSEGLTQSANGFSSEALMKNLSAATSITFGTNFYSVYRHQAFFGRVNYSLKKRYILNITARRDGSSRFGPGKQFATFGALGAAWIFSAEDLVKNNLPFLSFGKIRGSYGTTGNDQLGDYQYLDSYSSSGTYSGSVGLKPDRLSNPDFAWETNRKLEAAIELGFLNDRIFTTFSIYRNRSDNQLVGFPLPRTTGFTSIQGNFPATVQNSGIEIETFSRNIEGQSFTWTTSFNISIPRNRLVAFPGLETFPEYVNTYVVGEPLSIRKIYNYTGIDQGTGLHAVQDVNEDGLYNIQDRVITRFVGREFYGGLQNIFAYKGLQLDVFLQFVSQNGYQPAISFAAPGSLSNQQDLLMTRWREAGDNTTVQRFGQTSAVATAFSRFQNSGEAIGDASFVRLKNVSLAYTLPYSWIDGLNMSNVRVFVQGQNVMTFSSYEGLDPENPGPSLLPPLRVLSAGINITF